MPEARIERGAGLSGIVCGTVAAARRSVSRVAPFTGTNVTDQLSRWFGNV